MYCVVLNKIKDIYILRHIIHDVDKNDSLNIIKEKYYADYNKTSTDEFHLCQTKTEVSDILSALKISHWIDEEWYWSLDDSEVKVEITAWKENCEPYKTE